MTEPEMVLYLECQDLETRQDLMRHLERHGFEWLDCTGGQMACADGDLNKFGKLAVERTKQLGKELYRVMRIKDPGLGLCFSEEWLKKGIEAGKFQVYK